MEEGAWEEGEQGLVGAHPFCEQYLCCGITIVFNDYTCSNRAI